MVRNRRRKDARPDEIVDAAFECFAEDGYAGTRLDDVAANAGVSKGLVYLYFKTKEELFKAVIRRVVLPRVQTFARTMDDYDGSVEAFLAGPLVDFAVKTIESPVRHVVRLLIAEGPKHPDLLTFYHREVVSVAFAALQRLLARGVERGEFAPSKIQDHPHLVIAPIVVSMLWRILFQREQALPVRELIETHIAMLLAAMKRGEP